MSLPDRRPGHGANDEYAWIDPTAERLFEAAKDLLGRGEADRVSETAIRQLLTAAIRLYVARTDGEERTFRPLMGQYDDEVTATEIVSACSELLRALRLSPMELSIWFRQRPDDQGY
ncbi:hypothetical protein [Propylenella binzhouense]|uniref:Uncharacterized protein n=1 Tax=Propylenella binzhouense TaxID=2555902 RepID=A0A964T1N6_9HYPH|nr:hypothetical protein [Propylenella binzhouense]MYZ46352.1 hypothetical protein [Propylenella binzhouense]